MIPVASVSSAFRVSSGFMPPNFRSCDPTSPRLVVAPFSRASLFLSLALARGLATRSTSKIQYGRSLFVDINWIKPADKRETK